MAGYALSTLGLLLVILSLILMAIGSVLTAGEFAGLSEEGEIEGVFTPIFMLAFLLHPVAMYFTFFGYLCGHQANLESYKVHGDRSWFDKSFIKLSAISYSLLGVGYSISFMSELLIAPLIIFAIPVLVELLARFAVNSQINELDKKKIILLEKDTETGATPE